MGSSVYLFMILFEILFRQSAELFDQLNFLRIIGAQAGAVKIVEPFGEIKIKIGVLFVFCPGAFPGLVGLIFTGNQSPAIASDVFKIEKREDLLYIVVLATGKPLGVH